MAVKAKKRTARKARAVKQPTSFEGYLHLVGLRGEINERLRVIESDISAIQRYIGKLASMAWWKP